jgi:hypothetical protein
VGNSVYAAPSSGKWMVFRGKTAFLVLSEVLDSLLTFYIEKIYDGLA